MNTPKIIDTKETSRITNFTNTLFDVLWKKHETIISESKNVHSDYFERLQKAVEEIREEIRYDYTDIKEYEKRLLADDKIIEVAKAKLMNHPKLKPLFEEYKSIPWKSKWMEKKIWKKIRRKGYMCGIDK